MLSPGDVPPRVEAFPVGSRACENAPLPKADALVSSYLRRVVSSVRDTTPIEHSLNDAL